MDDETRRIQSDIIDAVEAVADISVTDIGMKEYLRGDPTVGDTDPTGAEIEITAYVSYEETDDDNPYQVK